ncbi:MAG: EAL domain-containing protein [Pseudomonadota bacterium]
MTKTSRNSYPVSRADPETTSSSGFDFEIYRTIVDRMEQGVLVYDEHRVLLANARLSTVLDCPQELVAPGASLEAFIEFGAKRGDYAASVGLTLQAMRMHIAAGKDYTVERNLPDGRTVRIDVRNQARFGVGTYTDVTRAKKQSAILETTVDTMAQGLLVCDRHNIVMSNGRLAELLSIPADSVEAGKPWQPLLQRPGDRLHDASQYEFLEKAAEALEADSHFTHEIHAGDRILWAECRCQHGMLFVTLTNVTEARAREQRLQESELEVRKLAETDGLTGLANRRLFDAELSVRFAEHRAGDRQKYMVVMLMDLDRFKAINDTHGHGVGDGLLQELSQRFASNLCDKCLIARIGGDEFAAIIHADSKYEIDEIARRICDAAKRTVIVGETRLQSGASIGLAFQSQEMADPDEMLTAADLALYDAKARGRGTVRVYAPVLGRKAMERYAIERDLAKSIENDELVLHYQGLHNLKADREVGYEALIRWNHPERGLLPPSDFIAIAEETGFIVEVGRWALETATTEIALRDRYSRVAVNVSPAQFAKSDLVSDVARALTRSGLQPNRLEIEITEDLLVENTEDTLTVLNQLRDMGVGVSLDDFGAGYSSLAYLTQFPFTKIKIDRMFIDRMVEDDASRALVNSMLVLASSLDLTVTAEGVETADQLAFLRANDCTEAQGFLLSRPSPIG